MRVVSLLPRPTLALVQRSIPAAARHDPAGTAAELASSIGSGECTHVVLDPDLVADIGLPPLAREIAGAGCKLLLVAQLNRRSVLACLAAQQFQPTTVVFCDLGENSGLRYYFKARTSGDAAA